MIKNKLFMVGVIIITISIASGLLFYNPNPCTSTCCGCDSIMQMICDTWGSYVSVFGTIFGMGIILGEVIKKNEIKMEEK